jgi:hypothetical protein
MQHFVGLDVSMKETAICVLGEQGRVVARRSMKPVGMLPMASRR